ncbi:TPA: hypothetical protein ACOEO2_000213 [Stenotrophomonas maltophilia]
MRSWELKGELDVEPEIEGVLGADPGIKGIFGGDLEIAGVLVGKYGRTAVGSGAFPLWQSRSKWGDPSINCHAEDTNAEDTNATTVRYIISHNVYYVQSIPKDGGVALASTTDLAMTRSQLSQQAPSRPGSYCFLHRPIRVLYMTQAIQPQTKPTPATMISSSSKAAPFSP